MKGKQKIDKALKVVVLFVFLFLNSASAQRPLKDSSIRIPYFSIHYQFQIPGGDMATRFGNNSNVGLSFFYKTQSNWMFSADWNYLFGKNIKDTGIFNKIGAKNPSGGTPLIIDKNGALATTRTWERGWHSTAKVGRQLFSLGPNPNCGFILLVGAGFLLHKIRIEDIGNNAPQLSKEYRKGYDRLTYGFAAAQFLGYQFFDNKLYINFLLGFESVQAFTRNRRGYLYDQERTDNAKRLDILNGFKIGFNIPIYRRTPDAYYFY